MGSDPQYIKYPDLSLAQHIFTLTNPSSTQLARQNGLMKLQEAISKDKMAPLYRFLAHPTEGLLNPTGEGSASKPTSTSSRQVNGTFKIGSSSTTPITALPWDETLFESLQEENKKELEAIDKEKEAAKENEGETEVQAAKGKRAEFWARVGDKVCHTKVVSC